MLMRKRNSFAPWFDKDDTGDTEAVETTTEETYTDTSKEDQAAIDKALMQSTIRSMKSEMDALKEQLANAKSSGAPQSEVDAYEDDITATRKEISELKEMLLQQKQEQENLNRQTQLQNTAGSVREHAKQHFDKQFGNRPLFKKFPAMKDHIRNIVASGLEQAVLGGTDASSLTTNHVNLLAQQEYAKYETMLNSAPQNKSADAAKQQEVNAAIREAGSGGTPSGNGAPKSDPKVDPDGFWKEKRERAKRAFQSRLEARQQ